MLKHNIKLTFRSFQRNKTSFLINLIGLSTGLACALLIYLWVNDEMSMDKFHDRDSQLYQVMLNLDFKNEIKTSDRTPVPLAEALVKELPEVETAVSVNDFFNWRSDGGILSNKDQQVKVDGIHSSEDFFNVFTFPLIEGEKDNVLVDKNGIVISESLAIKFFKTTENVVGKTLDWSHRGYDGTFQIAGVFQDIPKNSTIQFDVIFHLQLLKDNDEWAGNWTGNYAQTYLILNENVDVNQVNQKIDSFLSAKNEHLTYHQLFLQQYSSKYLNNNFENGELAGGRKIYVHLFSLIALFILLIACVNFMNLSTARASLRMKEIGIKKTIGATRGNLMIRLLGESVLLSFLALILAVVIVMFFLPQFNEITDKQLDLSLNPILISSTLSITFITGFIAGIYPAFYLSGFKPSSVLKGKLDISFGEKWIRKGLVVFQFTLSVIFIVGLLVIDQQIKLTQTKYMGYDRNNIISFQWKEKLYDAWSGLSDVNNNDQFFTFLDELKKVSGVVHATNMKGNILTNIYGQGGVRWNDDESQESANVKSPIVGVNFMKTLGIELIAGRTFSKEHRDDYSKLIINESAAKMMSFENPVGKKIRMNGDDEIVGVVKDFHYGSLYNNIEPLIFRFDPNSGHVLVKIQKGTEKNTIGKINQLYQKFHKIHPFEFTFMDEDYQAIYESETRVADLSKYFSGLAILISCLGLFGLAMFTTERRKKEIGIRKVLGSSVFGIVRMLTSDFTKTVLLAICISIPVSYIIAQKWLDNFAYNITLAWWLFLIPALAVLIIAWLTVGLQTVKAASVNPVESLKNE